jgi:zinc transport system substrate-binding protein
MMVVANNYFSEDIILKRAILLTGFCVCVIALAAVSCSQQAPNIPQHKRLTIVTSLFPLYDFARAVAKDKADVSLLLPPGVEAHSFEPRPGDILRIQSADLFIYTGARMEPWAAKILQGIENKNLLVIDASRGISLLQEVPDPGDKQHGTDPHIWLDFSNAQHMVDTIAEGLSAKDPLNRKLYADNARAYTARLAELDRRYRETLATCRHRVIIHGGHFAFGYLAKRYHLDYRAAYGFSPDAEPTPRRLYELSEFMKRSGIRCIFYEELLNPRVAETIARETGAGLLKLSAAHNVTKKEMEQGVGFIDIMEQNLKNLSRGLECR